MVKCTEIYIIGIRLGQMRIYLESCNCTQKRASKIKVRKVSVSVEDKSEVKPQIGR